jgi:hypothetical protein
MPILSDDRPFASISTAVDIAVVLIWALLLWLVTRSSKVSFTRDLFGG